MWHFRLLRKLSNRLLFPELDANDVGILVKDLRNGTVVRGFFQSQKHAYKLMERTEHGPLELLRPSENFLTTMEIMGTLNPLILHIRRGDYRNYADFGLLNADYYLRAIQLLRKKGVIGPIWVFSDEVVTATGIIEGCGLTLGSVFGPMDFNPAETLMLMASGSALVTANSTFSWWAGFISRCNSIVAPKPWFKNESLWLRESENLVPDEWLRNFSSWEE